jgi:hypothetical protein
MLSSSESAEEEGDFDKNKASNLSYHAVASDRPQDWDENVSK